MAKTVPLNPQPSQPGWKAFTQKRWHTNHPNAGIKKPAVAASDPASTAAMQTFRTTLAQLNTLSPEVDQVAVRKPYDAGIAATGQLGQGWSQAALASGQQAQQQYDAARNDSQQRAAQFGIAAGSGAAPTAIDDSGNDLLLSQQTQAHSAAALAAANAWQGLLQRASDAAVSKAQSDRQGVIDQGKQQLTLALPGMVQAERDRALQQKTNQDNLQALYAQLNEKQRAAITDEQLRAWGIKATSATAAANRSTQASIAADRLAETVRHNRETEAATIAKQRQAAKAGIKGIAEVMKLNPKSSGKSTKAARGFDALLIPINADGEQTGPAERQHVPRVDGAPPRGYKWASPDVKRRGTTHYEDVPAGGTGFNWSIYRQQVGILRAMNPGMTVAQAAALLPPTPKTSKKK